MKPRLNVESKHLVYIPNAPNMDWRDLKKKVNKDSKKLNFVETFEAWRHQKIGQVILEFGNDRKMMEFVDKLHEKKIFNRRVNYEILDENSRTKFFQDIQRKSGVDLLQCSGVPPNSTFRNKKKSREPKRINNRGSKTSHRHKSRFDVSPVRSPSRQRISSDESDRRRHHHVSRWESHGRSTRRESGRQQSSRKESDRRRKPRYEISPFRSPSRHRFSSNDTDSVNQRSPRYQSISPFRRRNLSPRPSKSPSPRRELPNCPLEEWAEEDRLESLAKVSKQLKNLSFSDTPSPFLLPLISLPPTPPAIAEMLNSSSESSPQKWIYEVRGATKEVPKTTDSEDWEDAFMCVDDDDCIYI